MPVCGLDDGFVAVPDRRVGRQGNQGMFFGKALGVFSEFERAPWQGPII
jgi:hypothetical protein